MLDFRRSIDIIFILFLLRFDIEFSSVNRGSCPWAHEARPSVPNPITNVLMEYWRNWVRKIILEIDPTFSYKDPFPFIAILPDHGKV